MRCACFRTDPAALLAALSSEQALARWQETITDEARALADRALIRHLRALTAVAGQVRHEGVERVAQRDPAAVDALLSELFAVATWHGWPLPIEPLGEQDLAVEGLPRGLLGADASRDGASLWLVDDQTVALARNRIVGSETEPGAFAS